MLALLLLGVTAYSAATYMLKDRVLPVNPTTRRVELQNGDPSLAAKMEPQSSAKYWSYGPRNFFQPPRANIKVTGHFTFSASGDKMDLARVSGYYQCVPDGPVDRVEIQIPAGWVPQTTGMGDTYKTKVVGTKRELLITLKDVQKTEFKVTLNLSTSVKAQPQVDFPEVIFKDAEAESGFLGLMGTASYDVKPGTVEKLDPVPADAAGLGGASQAYKYSSHPYKLSVALTRKQIVAGNTTKVTPPAVKPVGPVEPPKAPVPPAAEPAAKFEVPFTFKGMVKVDKLTVLLEDKQEKKLKRCSVGDTINGLTVTQIFATSVVVKDDKGNEYELQDSLRQKYDYE